MQPHDELIKEAKEAIRAVFSDTSVSKAETRCTLKDLIEEIEIMIDSLKD